MLTAFFLFAALKSVVVFVEQTPFGDVRRVATVLVDVDFFAAFRRRRFLAVAVAAFLRFGFGRPVLALLHGDRFVRFRKESLFAALAAVFVRFFGSDSGFDCIVLFSCALVLAVTLESSRGVSIAML